MILIRNLRFTKFLKLRKSDCYKLRKLIDNYLTTNIIGSNIIETIKVRIENTMINCWLVAPPENTDLNAAFVFCIDSGM